MYYFNKFTKIVVLYCFLFISSVSHAGSYEDFFHALRTDDVKVISQLLSRGFDPNTHSPEAEPALFNALKFESWKSVEVLVKHPLTKINSKNKHEETALMLVSLKGQFALAKLLVDRNADVNHPGWTPLHYAASAGKADIVQMLLDQSAYIDAESPNGTTPLMMAARYGSFEALKLLLTEGADIRLKNQQGLSALDFAVEGQRPDAQKLIESSLKPVSTLSLPK